MYNKTIFYIIMCQHMYIMEEGVERLDSDSRARYTTIMMCTR